MVFSVLLCDIVQWKTSSNDNFSYCFNQPFINAAQNTVKQLNVAFVKWCTCHPCLQSQIVCLCWQYSFNRILSMALLTVSSVVSIRPSMLQKCPAGSDWVFIFPSAVLHISRPAWWWRRQSWKNKLTHWYLGGDTCTLGASFQKKKYSFQSSNTTPNTTL